MRVFLLCLVLAGCAIASDMTMPDGSKGYRISCDGMAMSMGDCYQKAGNLCPKGYAILGKDGYESQPVTASKGGFTANRQSAQGGYTTYRGGFVQRSLFIKCNGQGSR